MYIILSYLELFMLVICRYSKCNNYFSQNKIFSYACFFFSSTASIIIFLNEQCLISNPINNRYAYSHDIRYNLSFYRGSRSRTFSESAEEITIGDFSMISQPAAFIDHRETPFNFSRANRERRRKRTQVQSYTDATASRYRWSRK